MRFVAFTNEDALCRSMMAISAVPLRCPLDNDVTQMTRLMTHSLFGSISKTTVTSNRPGD